MQDDVPFDILQLPHRAAVWTDLRHPHPHAGSGAVLKEAAQHPFHERSHL